MEGPFGSHCTGSGVPPVAGASAESTYFAGFAKEQVSPIGSPDNLAKMEAIRAAGREQEFAAITTNWLQRGGVRGLA